MLYSKRVTHSIFLLCICAVVRWYLICSSSAGVGPFGSFSGVGVSICDKDKAGDQAKWEKQSDKSNERY